jgi:hypothetical protein
MKPIDPAAIPRLIDAIGPSRFGTFTKATGENITEAIRLYSWNVDVSASLWGGFHILEVTLRNAFHAELAHCLGLSDWWAAAPLSIEDEKAISDAVRFLRRAKRDAWEPDDPVAELSFGFWIGLIANRYHARFWTPALRNAVPHYSGRRGHLHTALERLRKLRKRVAHHEPIFERDLSYDHAMLLSLLGYVNPASRMWAHSHSRLPAILKGKPATLDGTRPTRF